MPRQLVIGKIYGEMERDLIISSREFNRAKNGKQVLVGSLSRNKEENLQFKNCWEEEERRRVVWFSFN